MAFQTAERPTATIVMTTAVLPESMQVAVMPWKYTAAELLEDHHQAGSLEPSSWVSCEQGHH